MKRILYILMAMAVLASCSKHEDPDKLPEVKHPMIISVTDGGYAASDKSSAQTRAVENGYVTELTVGDQIGLYVVKTDGSYIHQNIALTLTDIGSGTLAWVPPAGTKLYYEGATAKYFAYYPYQANVTGNLVANATTAASFFTNVVSEWTPDTDQSTYAKYTASDLMIGSGTVSKASGVYTLALTMSHAMALVVIETPTAKYALRTDANYTWTAAAPDTKFYGFTPYFIDDKYRLLVKPNQSGTSDLYGCYTAQNGSTKEYAVAQNSIAAASYVHSKVDGGSATVITKTHTLQVGDFYLKDGSLVGKDANLTAEQQAACIGIVYWTDDPTRDDDALKRDYSGCTHGLVVALHEAKQPSASAPATMKWSINYEKVNAWTNHSDRGADKVNITEQNRYQGYANTVALKAYNEQQSDDDLKVLPITAIEQYSADYPAPTNSSGWYVPSIMELKYMCWGQGNGQGTTGRNLLNDQFAKVGGTNFDGSWYYWSSSEDAVDSSGAWGVDFGDKSYIEFWIRALFAF